MSPEYLNAQDAAAFLGLSQQTLANWRSDGRGPRFRKIGGKRVCYRVADLRAFAETGAPHAPDAKPQPAAA